ncbi:MAG: hypothetical protein ACK56I_04415, partial [bacterium]
KPTTYKFHNTDSSISDFLSKNEHDMTHLPMMTSTKYKEEVHNNLPWNAWDYMVDANNSLSANNLQVFSKVKA